MGIWRLTVRDEFCAAHALRNYHGKCERTHGHNYAVALSLEGRELDPETGMLLDFGIMKRILRECLEELDHQFLNEQEPFELQNPSSENLARHIWHQANKKLKDIPEACRAKITIVKVAEKSSQEAEYSEE